MEFNADLTNLTIPETIFLWFKSNIMEIVGAIAVLVIGLLIAGILSRAASKALTKSDKLDPSVAGLLASLIKYALWALVFVTVLTQFGVETTSIIAALGGMALAIGLALQGTLSNVASGVMILVQKPFKVGEAIEVGGITAVVQQIGLFTTELKQFDGLFVMMPNNELWNKPIINFHRHPVRRFELVVGIGYGDSMERARDVLMGLAGDDERVLADPAPQAFVHSLGDSSVGIGLRVWCNTADYAPLSWDLTEAAKAKFDEQGISIPFPQREITSRTIIEERKAACSHNAAIR